MTRLLTAILLAPLIVAIVLVAPWWLFQAVVAVIAILCFHEYRGIAAGHGVETPRVAGFGLGLLLLLLPGADLTVFIALTLLVLALALRSSSLAMVLPRAGALVLGLAYVFGAWRCAIGLHEVGHHWLMFALALNWLGDTAAYYVGRAIGKHKLAPRVSPAKSWEGSAASVAASMLFGWLYLSYFVPGTPLAAILFLSAAGNIAGQIGDLSESALKRGAGIKDSGALLPGHGGWLDRVDSSLFSVPLIYLCLKIGAR